METHACVCCATTHDVQQGCAILSGDVISDVLAQELEPECVVFLVRP